MRNGGAERDIRLDLNTYQVQAEAIALVPAAIAVKHNVIPLAIDDHVLVVGMANTEDMLAIQELAAVCKMRIRPVEVEAAQIKQSIDYNYKAYQEVERQFSNDPQPTFDDAVAQEIAGAPAVKSVDLIVGEAVKLRASDIHIEPQLDKLRVRYRIDGVLHDTMSLPLSAHAPLISRIKIMASMNIADHRPQDGQTSVKAGKQEIDIRVATVNTIYGEMASLRILDKSFAARTLSELGFSPKALEQYQNQLKSPLGMLLVCGPTGSGKTTTLYASINGLDRKGKKIITIEDPVEYRFENIDQIHVNAKSNVTFASGLRSLMRHDPDVIMIGEIRDGDTAAMATQAALTGQLVLSSVHANDSVGAILRLLDFGIGPFIISATLICVVSQRMARRVCPHCSHLTKAPSDAQLAYFRETGENRTEFFYGRGCNACANTGYLGRVAISEVMVMNPELRSAIMRGAGADELRSVAKDTGMVSMWRDGMLKVKAGTTTPSEVLRNILFTG